MLYSNIEKGAGGKLLYNIYFLKNRLKKGSNRSFFNLLLICNTNYSYCSDYVTIRTLQIDFISYNTANYVTLVTMLHKYITLYNTTSLTYGTFTYYFTYITYSIFFYFIFYFLF